ncbi:hypothetical protein [Klebsiella huaxiensis]|uniref:Uncharacterized protein n=1 Tax=Klebsiella huaxiensis TaxID=2153354 RepID=A0ABT6E9P9_9ENTR|nr:hypothetical protein [Klebsiella huaxiensis]MDG1641885.1 hypothetical protein [Klebsiella huaxiensis]
MPALLRIKIQVRCAGIQHRVVFASNGNGYGICPGWNCLVKPLANGINEAALQAFEQWLVAH